MNRTLHNLSYVSTSTVGIPPGIEPDDTAHAFLEDGLPDREQPALARRVV
ncbi:putative membrane protein [Burkholderia pseudomallei 406e]|uniref:Uncharacterized protein n=3 Tax=pseudomallei group TaxID=111527 RepID=A2RYL8_BURM9|nr:hypothetical protein BMASAVP1_0682 [Burkholderia mallei SAVP1]ABN00024.1 hypothetical protein BMA10229_0978 [Burkholderia mallei NCTC 10229]ABN82197.1 hypothetical protein BURPS668_3596 [Burkholderia pseudomallei 668]ABN91403.1 hypothetical protein BURPS1106A_3620 [Burkholderia pseudomallei 1106a]ABO02684.1 hypothetical protein BMA10247_A1949 [Burkholderia mallei NCTC 10247]ACQ98573.1 conserved hypothetical protein [Burkholderia pseudomallei MSHR346]AFR17513.1 hypothetical protein BPC006_I